jgi:hypothetical protein
MSLYVPEMRLDEKKSDAVATAAADVWSFRE